MRAHFELTPAERKLLTTMTAEERQVVIAQMIETECEELEWQIAVEQARSVAEAVPALVARKSPPPIPPRSRAMPTRTLPRYRWSSSTPARAAK